jgi:autotransporter-associated beta strand protein
VAGGNGGDGGAGGGTGGSGGDGVALPVKGSFTNSGSVVGGKGGDGGLGGGTGGDGGDGVVGGTLGTTFTNSGSVAGGNGGDGGANGGVGGKGGIGVIAENVIDSGEISGGLASDSVTRADAIASVHILELLAGYQIIGNVVAAPSFASPNTLVLGGDANSQFDVSQIGPQYQGFPQVEKTGSSTWTLENSSTAVMHWIIDSGVLQVSSDGALGDSSGLLAFNGGTLQFLSAFSTVREILLNANGTFDTNGNNATLAGLIDGNGGLVKIDAGVLTLSQSNNTYADGTFLNGGALDVAALGAAGTGQITYGTGVETLKIENVALSPVSSTVNSFGNPIQVTGVGDIIDLTGLIFAKKATVSYNPNTDLLSVSSGGVTDNLTVAAPHGATFALSSDGTHGTDVTLIGIATLVHGHGL